MSSQGESNLYAPPSTDDTPLPSGGQGTAPRPLASLGARLAGSLVDGLIYGVPLVPAFVLLEMSDDSAMLALAGLGFVGFAVIGIVQIYLISTSGQSLGKKLLKTRIIREDGSPVDFVSAVLVRAWLVGLIGVIPIVGSLFQLADPLFIFGERRQCIHDHIANTLVIDVSYGG